MCRIAHILVHDINRLTNLCNYCFTYDRTGAPDVDREYQFWASGTILTRPCGLVRISCQVSDGARRMEVTLTGQIKTDGRRGLHWTLMYSFNIRHTLACIKCQINSNYFRVNILWKITCYIWNVMSSQLEFHSKSIST